jgi:eukaryotic-like serine/threonine-protein kinase
MPLPAGSKLDSFEIVGPLGAGGMGEVYRARDIALKREVAIKVLPHFWSHNPERLLRFELEAQAAATLHHPNVVSIFHVGRHKGSYGGTAFAVTPDGSPVFTIRGPKRSTRSR